MLQTNTFCLRATLWGNYFSRVVIIIRVLNLIMTESSVDIFGISVSRFDVNTKRRTRTASVDALSVDD